MFPNFVKGLDRSNVRNQEKSIEVKRSIFNIYIDHEFSRCFDWILIYETGRAIKKLLFILRLGIDICEG